MGIGLDGLRAREKADTREGDATAATALTATLGLAAACWVVAVWRMTGMDMGVATRLGSFAFFCRAVGDDDGRDDAAGRGPGRGAGRPRRRGARGLAVHRVLPGGLGPGGCRRVRVRPAACTAVAVAVTIAAGLYELAPVKWHFRRRCRETAGSGFGFGLSCAGSSAGLMATLVVLGVMSVGWMAVIAVLVTAQKLLPPGLPWMCRSPSRSSYSGS